MSSVLNVYMRSWHIALIIKLEVSYCAQIFFLLTFLRHIALSRKVGFLLQKLITTNAYPGLLLFVLSSSNKITGKRKNLH